MSIFNYPENRLFTIRKPPILPSPDPAALLTELLAHSDAFAKFAVSAVNEGKALVICDDCTRPTPTPLILSVLIRHLGAYGLHAENVTVLFATGSHAAVTTEGAYKKIGAELWGRVKWFSHDWQEHCACIGYSASGIPIDINPILLEYKSIAGIGSVFPHRYCGWSGGGKLVFPGVSSPRTISRMHWLPYFHDSIYLGSTNNPAITEIDSASEKAGLSFLIQCITDASGNIHEATAGRPVQAHKDAVRSAFKLMKADSRQADIVVAQAWPEDGDLWQAGKALYAAENVVKPGGCVILEATLANGIGPHLLYAELMNAPKEKITSLMNACFEKSLAAAAAYVTMRVRDKARIVLVTDSSFAEEIHIRTGLPTFIDNASAIAGLLKDYSSPTFCIIPEAPLVFPVLVED